MMRIETKSIGRTFLVEWVSRPPCRRYRAGSARYLGESGAMARPTVRVLALLELLQGGGLHPVPDLARRLDVDERTVRRYVTHLLELEVPVEAVRGRYGGYRLATGYRMPPLMLTDEEALALVLGTLA